jgi:hypothetical protein
MFLFLLSLWVLHPLFAQPAGVTIDTIPPQVKINYPSGTYNKLITISFKTNESAAIFYTLDDAPPTEKAFKYSGLLTLSKEGETILRFFAVDLVGNKSKEYKNVYFLDTRAPDLNISPFGGKFGQSVKVQIQPNEASDIYFTLDNSVPTTSSISYKMPFSVTNTCTLKVLAVDKAGNTSDIIRAFFVIDKNIPVVNVSHEGGLSNKPIRIRLNAASGISIFYSLDEFAPLSSYTPYTQPLKLKPGQTILSYYGKNQVGTYSDVLKKVYIYDRFPPKVNAISKDLGTKWAIILRSNERASLFYTLDGSLPSEKSTPYKGTIYIPKKGVATLKVFAKDLAGNIKDDFSQKFSFDTTPPKLMTNPKPGLYNKPIKITIRANEKTKIFYTLNNTMPTKESAVYSRPISLTKDGKTVLTFFGLDEGDNQSKLFSVIYTVDLTPPAVQPRIERDTSNKKFTVTFVHDEHDRIYYTTNGSEPSFASKKYSGPFTVFAGQSVKYFAVDLAGNKTRVIDLTEIALPRVTAKPGGGIFNRVTRVSLVSNLPGKIFYRLESKRYEKGDFLEYLSPIALKINGLYKIEYYCLNRQGNMSTINEETYFIDLFPPEIKIFTRRNPFDSTIIVNFQASENLTIYYTLDGTNPFASPTAKVIGNKYFLSKDKITLKQTADVKITFLGEDIAGNRSELYQFDINLPTVIPNPPAGNYNKILNVNLTTYNEATIYYTKDGSTPSDRSPIYRNPIPVTKNTILKYFAVDRHGYRGKIAGSRYTIDLPPRPDFVVENPLVIEGTRLTFNAATTVDEESDPASLLFKWDFDGDGKWDTKFSADPKSATTFKLPGIKNVSLIAKDNAGLTATLTKKINVVKDCPNDMIPFNSGQQAFCIDKYEYPNRKSAVPLTDVTWVQAVMRCRNAGKNLCSFSEWKAACAGKQQRDYPYGNVYEKNKCNTETSVLALAGTNDQCKNKAGVYDLTGNAWEWILDRKDGYNIIIGGNFFYGKNARCDASFHNLISNKNQGIGFRCCKQ